MKKETLLNVATIVLLFVIPHIARLPFFLYTIICLGLIAVALRANNKSWRDLGLARPASMTKMFAIGVVSAIAWTAFNQLVYIPFIHAFFDVPPYTEYDFLKGNPAMLAFVLLAAWVVGGFYEELAFRGFIQGAILRRNVIGAAIATSILFGLYHWQQGIFGVIASALGGLYWSWLRMRHDNLWPSIYSHAIYDTIALTMIYSDVFGLIRFV